MQLTQGLADGTASQASGPLTHIIIDARGDIETAPDTPSPPRSSTPTESASESSPESVSSPLPAVLPETETETETGLHYPQHIIDVLIELYDSAELHSDANKCDQLTLLWELTLMHLFPSKRRQKGHTVVYSNLVPDLVKFELSKRNIAWEAEDDARYFSSLSALSETSHPSENIMTLAVLQPSVSTTAPQVIVQILPTPPARSANPHEEDVRGCDSLLTRSAQLFDALAPYSPYRKILIISVYGPGRSANGADWTAPQMSAVVRDTNLTSGEAMSLVGGERRMGWTDLHEVFGLWEQSVAADHFLALVNSALDLQDSDSDSDSED
ncbi:hypothetical protein HGRIS_007126 [Hohenbuehelia grisea]|uniref:Uncharacterized protein n=1 Tax=Hohenbuehelia grisea TaxID=104357 RepID=A0ABR3JBI3_9AGAR